MACCATTAAGNWFRGRVCWNLDTTAVLAYGVHSWILRCAQRLRRGMLNRRSRGDRADAVHRQAQHDGMLCWTRQPGPVSYTHLRAHETVLDLVCRLLLEKKKKKKTSTKLR